MSDFDTFYQPGAAVEKCSPPVLLKSISQSDRVVWSIAPLSSCLPDLEQMLMRSPSAGKALDRLIGKDVVGRGAYLIEVCMQAVKERPEVGRYIRGAAMALKNDKSVRADSESTEMPAMRPVQRGVTVLLRQQNSADAMDMAPTSA